MRPLSVLDFEGIRRNVGLSIGGRAANAGAVLAGAALLLVPAALNGFPFVLDDTMGYVKLEIVTYHSIFYNLFVLVAGLQWSPWLVAAAQALIISHVIWVWQRVICGETSPFSFLVAMILLAGLTSVGLVSAYLMPDIFTSVAILAIGLLGLMRHRLSRREQAYFFALATLAVSVHLSHAPIAAGVVAAVIAAQLISGRSARHSLASAAIALAPVAAAAGALFASNVVLHGVPKLSPAGPVFLLANLIGKGPARDYLAEVCPAAGYKICDQLAELPTNSNSFLWAGTLGRLGGFDGYREEASRIAAETIKSRPYDVAVVSATSVLDALQTRAPGWDYRPLGGNTGAFESSIEDSYGPGAVAAWRQSLQAKDDLPRAALKAIDEVVLPVSLAVALIGLVLAWRMGWHDILSLTTVILAGAAANVVVCAVGSGVFDRYQARVTWLIPFAAVFVALRALQQLSFATPRLLSPSAANIPQSETA